MGSRSALQCMTKWRTEAPNMIELGTWGKGDDRRMLKKLLQCSYAEEWQVKWAELVEVRHKLMMVYGSLLYTQMLRKY